MTFVLAFFVGYLLGSIPFGLILTRLGGGRDPRSIGSGNIGATNVLRTGNKALAAATLVGDMLKGTFAVLLAAHFAGHGAALAAGAGVFLGHVFPVWLKFKGGKGVATYIGVLIALYWPAAAIFGVVWLATACLTRYSSLAALIASALTPLVLWLFNRPDAAIFYLALSALIWVFHRANIARLLAGNEGKIGAKSAPAP